MFNREIVFDLVLNALEDQEFYCDADLLREYITVNNFEGEEIGVIHFGEEVTFDPCSSYGDTIDYVYLIIETVLSTVRWLNRNA
jgi:hypothetical protein|nr:MAG TPA: hypothetical protein [Caudoviricetes sp.]